VITGYKKALELGMPVVIKIDGDGQMDLEYLEDLIQPILDNQADYTKGNRFYDFKALRQMPKIDLIVNMGAYFSTFSYNSQDNNRLNLASNFY